MEELIIKFKNSHDFTKVLIIAFVLVIFAAIAGFILLKLQNKTQVVNLISTTTPSVLNAGAYRNNQYGFTFKLPEGWNGYKIVSGTREIRDVNSGNVLALAPNSEFKMASGR